MWRVIGHQRALAALERALVAGRLAGTYLLLGPPNVGKTTLALDLACAVNCLAPEPGPCGRCSPCRRVLAGLHTDVTFVEIDPGRREVVVHQVLELQRALSLRPFEGRCRVAIIPEAGRLNPEAANKLLKTLEEPAPDALLLLCATDAEDVLPTVRSRCQALTLQPVPERVLAGALEAAGTDPGQAQAVAAFARGRPGLALRALQDASLLAEAAEHLALLRAALAGGVTARLQVGSRLASGTANAAQRDAVLRVLETWVLWWRDALLHKAGAGGPYTYPGELPAYRAAAELDLLSLRNALAATQAARRQVQQNANPRLVLDVLTLGFPRVNVPDPAAAPA